MIDLAEKVKARTRSNSEVRLISYQEAYGGGFEDMRRRVPDISKVEQLIGWRPERDLDAILRDVITSRAGGADQSLPVAAA